jgi:hypothetical protein
MRTVLTILYLESVDILLNPSVGTYNGLSKKAFRAEMETALALLTLDLNCKNNPRP